MDERAVRPVQSPAGDDPMTAFRARVLADASLQARLGAIEHPDRYVAEAVAIARTAGIALPADAIRAALRPDPLALGRFLPSAATLDRWPPPGWLPARSVPTGGAPAFDWLWFGGARLDAPFFDDMIRTMAPRPFNRMFGLRTDAAALLAGAGAGDDPAPSGFIHHMSRCGSTLAAQMLAADPSHRVLSEAEPLDAVVRWAVASGAPLAEQVAMLRAIVAALARDGARRLFVKLDSWHVLALPLFRAAFPSTPWVYLYRAPIEVLVSQRRSRGIHTVAGMLPTRLIAIRDAERLDADHHAALVLRRMGDAVLGHRTLGGGLLVDYREMPGAVVRRIAPHFGFLPDSQQIAAMSDVANRDAKTPGKIFVPDSFDKRESASDELKSLARRIVDPVYDRLEAIRVESLQKS